jgi:hypothetical protein
MPAGFDGVSGTPRSGGRAAWRRNSPYREYLTTPQHFLNLVARLRPA